LKTACSFACFLPVPWAWQAGAGFAVELHRSGSVLRETVLLAIRAEDVQGDGSLDIEDQFLHQAADDSPEKDAAPKVSGREDQPALDFF
jgi:hypothetical protein